MKLNAALTERALHQFEAQAIPDNHPVVGQLNSMFGDHTFFLTVSGLHVVEPTEPPAAGEPTGQIVKLASWSDQNRTSLVPHEPEPTEVVVDLGATDGLSGE